MAEELKLFEGNRIRHVCDEEKETYYFSVVDIVAILMEKDYQSAIKYWNKLAQRLRDEGSEQTVTNCHQLKLQADDGKMRKADVADIKTIFRIIQSIPSKKAVPIKRWLAKVGQERVQEMNKVIANSVSHDDLMLEHLKDNDYQRIYLETSLEEFAKDGNINAFIRSLQHVVKARGRGAISALAKELDIDRSNLSDILNGKVQPKISTTLKLINGLGYKIQLKLA